MTIYPPIFTFDDNDSFWGIFFPVILWQQRKTCFRKVLILRSHHKKCITSIAENTREHELLYYVLKKKLYFRSRKESLAWLFTFVWIWTRNGIHGKTLVAFTPQMVRLMPWPFAWLGIWNQSLLLFIFQVQIRRLFFHMILSHHGLIIGLHDLQLLTKFSPHLEKRKHSLKLVFYRTEKTSKCDTFRWHPLVHSVWKSLKMSHMIFPIWHFSPIFVLWKVTCLVTLFDRKLQVFKNSPNWPFWHFWLIFVHS